MQNLKLHYITLHFAISPCHSITPKMIMQRCINNYMLYEIQPTGQERGLATQHVGWARPQSKISCGGANRSNTHNSQLLISLPWWRNMSLTAYRGQPRMSLTFYAGQNFQESGSPSKEWSIWQSCPILIFRRSDRAGSMELTSYSTV